MTPKQKSLIEADCWRKFSYDYDRQVFSLTSFPPRREQLLSKLTPGAVLNIGCGSADYLNRDLIQAGHPVVATDFCQTMLDQSSRNFSTFNLQHKLADSRDLPFVKGSFENIASVNSILPPTRVDVQKMFSEIFRVLKPEGIFVGFLVSFESTLRAKQNLKIDLELDEKELRVKDTTGWQCFHSRESILLEMGAVGFAEIQIEPAELSDRAEIAELERLYGVNTSISPIFEHFVFARKPE